MRYKETGELHLDFHGATYTTIKYILKHYGKDGLREIFRNTGTQVYKAINTELKEGKTKELIDFWEYFFNREKGDFSITEQDDGSIELLVKECPAVRHVKKLGMDPGEDLCLQTFLLNEGLCDGSDFEIITEKLGLCSCRQILRRKGGEA